MPKLYTILDFWLIKMATKPFIEEPDPLLSLCFLNPFAVTGVPCEKSCLCYYNQHLKANLFDCSDTKLNHLPTNVQNGTNWMDLHGNSISSLCQTMKFDKGVTLLNLSSNNLQQICPEFIDSRLPNTELTQVDLSQNKLQYLPKKIMEANHLTKIWLTGNDFFCDCSMLWMIEWVANFTSPSGENVIQDHKKIMCANEEMAGLPIYQLNRVSMGCFPERMSSWEIALLAITGILVIAVAILIVIIFKKREEIKFRLLRDKGENLQGKEADVLISYR